MIYATELTLTSYSTTNILSLSLLLDPSGEEGTVDEYVALDETEDKSDCKVRPSPAISTSYSLSLLLTSRRSDSNLVHLSYVEQQLFY
jgi:hypothetical protein